MGESAVSRRQFLASAGALGVGFSLFPSRVLGANERVNLGLIGIGKKGGGHLRDFGSLKNAEIIAASDLDPVRLGRAGSKVKKHKDFRRLLEMKDVDAVIIVTPDHWHCLAAIMAFQAGKHAYVEKPVSHSIWEGRKMVEACRKYDRISQAGTQQRSCPAVQECAEDVQSGVYGKVLWVHCSQLSSRAPIGKVDGPQPPPPGLDYDMWAGPAPKAPIRRKRFHYDWHWQWNWGTGEMGNWGVHYIDDLRNILGWDDVPDNVMALGNRWWDDDGETPNMHLGLMEHKGVKIVVDIRNLEDPGRGGDAGAVYLGSRSGNYIMCEKAFIRISRGGGKAYDKDGKQIKQYKGDGGDGHAANFVDAVRNESSSKLNCEIETGHLSSSICHLINISYRLGKASSVEALRENVSKHESAVNALNSVLDQLNRNSVDLEKKPFIVGPKLSYDPKKEEFVGTQAQEANAFVRYPYRKGFVVPEKI